MKKAHVPFYVERVAIRGPSFADLASRAIRELRHDGATEIVCGPITTGGFENVALNMLVFNYAIGALQYVGRPIWSQLPYEAGLADLEAEWKSNNPNAGYCHPILTELYDVIFQAQLLRRAWFIDTWESSEGAQWEYKRMTALGLEVRVLPKGWLDDYTLLRDLE